MEVNHVATTVLPSSVSTCLGGDAGFEGVACAPLRRGWFSSQFDDSRSRLPIAELWATLVFPSPWAPRSSFYRTCISAIPAWISKVVGYLVELVER